jgi:hypothetical protein
MKKLVLIISTVLLLITCEKDNNDLLIGKWRLTLGYHPMVGYHDITPTDIRYEEYTRRNIRIVSDHEGNETARGSYKATNSTITCYGKDNDGSDFSFDYEYSFLHDTLAIRHDGGFEFYMEYFIRED